MWRGFVVIVVIILLIVIITTLYVFWKQTRTNKAFSKELKEINTEIKQIKNILTKGQTQRPGVDRPPRLVGHLISFS